MIDLSIAQAIFQGQVVRARSTNFDDGWLPELESVLSRYGQYSGENQAVFARPFGKKQVAIAAVQGGLCRVLVLGLDLYFHLHDPFAITERFAPAWEARGALPDLSWDPVPLPARTIAQLDAILKNGDGPFLLGASQTIVDGGRIVIERPAPDTKLLQDLWALLPDSVRRIVWPASFAPGNELEFDIVVLPAIPDGRLPGYLLEDQARDYPESRYERSLQAAIEEGDQAALDQLLARKHANEMIRLALLIIGLAVGIVGLVRVLAALRLI